MHSIRKTLHVETIFIAIAESYEYLRLNIPTLIKANLYIYTTFWECILDYKTLHLPLYTTNKL